MPSIGLDIGHSAVKAAFADDRATVRTFLLPSVVCHAQNLSFGEACAGTSEDTSEDTIEVGPHRYFVGQTALLQGGHDVSSSLSDNWIEQPEHAALLLAVHRRVIAMGADPTSRIVLGLPTALFVAQKDRLREIAELHLSSTGTARVQVVPQPVGPYFDRILDDEGLPLTDPDPSTQSWAVLDIGWYTTDFVLLRSNVWVEKGTGSCSGVHLAAELVQRELSRHGIRATLHECETSLRTNTIRNYGKDLDIASLVQPAIAHLAAVVTDRAVQMFDSFARSLDGIIVAGGGAELLTPDIQQRWPHAVKAANPRFAVCLGFRKYGLLSELVAETA